MMNAMRTTMRAALAALPLLAAGMLTSSPAWAQPQDGNEDAFEAATPKEPTSTPAQPRPPETPAQAPATTPPAPAPMPYGGPQPYNPMYNPTAVQPPPMGPQSSGYPYARRPKQEPAESEGPVTSWEQLRFAVALEGRGSLLFDRGAKRLTGDRRPMSAGLSLQGDVFQWQDKLAVRLDLAWVTSSHSSYLNGWQTSESLKTNLFSLGLAARYHLLRWLAPYARLSGGIGWDKLSVADMSDTQRFAHGSVGGGVFLRSPGIRPSQASAFPAIGLVGHVEAGYALASGSDFVLSSSPAPGSTTPIPTSSVELGHVGRNAPYLRVSLGLAF